MDEGLYHRFFEQEEYHWWFAARSVIVQRMIRSFGNVQRGETVLDVGCGTGAILKALSASYDVVGLDTSPLAVDYSRRRGLVNVFQMPVEQFPKEHFHVKLAILLDVIEHIEDDLAVLQAVRGLLEPGGRVIITVPANMWMWSAHDVVNQHKRRYSKASLASVIDRAGFELVKISFYNTFLFPLVGARKVIDAWRGVSSAHLSDQQPNGILNAVLKGIFAAEQHVLPWMNFPLGISLFAIAQDKRPRI